MLPWLSARPDNKEGRFLMIGNSLLLSKKFQDLSAGSRFLYMAMSLEAGGKREFQFSRSSIKKFGVAETSFSRYLKELIDGKYIEVVFSGRHSHEKISIGFHLIGNKTGAQIAGDWVAIYCNIHPFWR